MISERIRRRLELRRSNAAGPHKQKPRDVDWRSDWDDEPEREHVRP